MRSDVFEEIGQVSMGEIASPTKVKFHLEINDLNIRGNPEMTSRSQGSRVLRRQLLALVLNSVGAGIKKSYKVFDVF